MKINMTQKEVYANIYKASFENSIKNGLEKDKASKITNKCAIENTWPTFNHILKCNNTTC